MVKHHHDRVLAIDIETVLDRDLPSADQGPGTYAKASMHRVVAISFVEARIERSNGSEAFLIEECRSGGDLDYDEPHLLTAFWRHLDRTLPRLVTWNGRGHDLAVLRLRAMMHGLDVSCWSTRRNGQGYQFRYSADWHCDLADQVSDFGASLKLTLQQAAEAFGFPGKIVTGPGTVQSLFEAGRLSEIRQYCEIDAVNAFAIYLKWAKSAGLSSAPDCERGLLALERFLAERRAVAPHLGRFLDGMKKTCSPRPTHVGTSGTLPASESPRPRPPFHPPRRPPPIRAPAARNRA